MTHLASRTLPCHLSRTLRYAFAVRPTPRQQELAPSGSNRIGTGLHEAAVYGGPRRPLSEPIQQWMAQTCADTSLDRGLRAQMIHDMTIIITDTLRQRQAMSKSMGTATPEPLPGDIIKSACQHLQQLFQPARAPAERGDMHARRIVLQQLGNLVILAAQTSSRQVYERSART